MVLTQKYLDITTGFLLLRRILRNNRYGKTYKHHKRQNPCGTSFGLQGSDAEQLYYQMILIALGLAHTCTRGGSTLSIHDSEWAELERVFRNTFNLTPLHNILLLHANRMSMKLRLMVFSVVRSYEITEGFVRIQICSS